MIGVGVFVGKLGNQFGICFGPGGGETLQSTVGVNRSGFALLRSRYTPDLPSVRVERQFKG